MSDQPATEQWPKLNDIGFFISAADVVRCGKVVADDVQVQGFRETCLDITVMDSAGAWMQRPSAVVPVSAFYRTFEEAMERYLVLLQLDLTEHIRHRLEKARLQIANSLGFYHATTKEKS